MSVLQLCSISETAVAFDKSAAQSEVVIRIALGNTMQQLSLSNHVQYVALVWLLSTSSAVLHDSQERDSAGGLYVTLVIHAVTPSQVRITFRCKFYILLSLIYVHKLPQDHWAHMNKANGAIP